MNLTGFVTMLVGGEATTMKLTSVRQQKCLCGVLFMNTLVWFGWSSWWRTESSESFLRKENHLEIGECSTNCVLEPGPLVLNSKSMLNWQIGVKLNFRKMLTVYGRVRRQQSTILNKQPSVLALSLLELTCQFALSSWLWLGKLKRWVIRPSALCRVPCSRHSISLGHIVFQYRICGSWDWKLIFSAQPLRMIRFIAREKTFVWALESCHSSKSQSGQKINYDSQLVLVTWKVTWAQ